MIPETNRSNTGNIIIAAKGIADKGYSEDEIREAKTHILNFIVSDKGKAIIGPLVTFKGVLTRFTEEYPNPKNAFPYTGALLAEVINQGLDEEVIDEKVGALYFDDYLDQVSFVDDLVGQILNFEAPSAITDEIKFEAQNELIEFITSRAFKQVGDTFDEFIKQLEEAHDEKDKTLWLFAKIIVEGVEQGLLSDRVGKLFFAHQFDRGSMMAAVKEGVFLEAQRRVSRNRKIMNSAQRIQVVDPELALQLGRYGTKKLAASCLNLSIPK